MYNFGESLKYQRELRGLSQSELAKKLKFSQQAISLWESNKRIPNIANCAMLADFYEIALDELIGRGFFK